jgi:hypothetical protein
MPVHLGVPRLVHLNFLSDKAMSKETGGSSATVEERHPEDYIVRHLIDYNDIDYGATPICSTISRARPWPT